MKRISMKKIKEIIKLCATTDLSYRKISIICNVSRPVVTKFIIVFKSSGLSYEDIKDMNEDSIYELFFKESSSRLDDNDRYVYLSSHFEYYAKELKRKHVTLQKLWEEYIQENPNGYSRTSFFVLFKKWRKSCELTMHIDHKAADKMFVDFTGKKLYLTDKNTGETRAVETFVAILPASHYTYVCVTETQKTKDWLKASEEAFWYFGGATKVITPDCCKSVVKKPNRYDPDINPEYSNFAKHYNCVILPARPIHPKDKALVENAVKIVYHWIYASLRDRKFYTIGELNAAILDELKKYNLKKMQTTKLSRFELFNKSEKNHLNNLPISLYEYRKCSRATIQSNYHVLLSEDKKYYSVPYKYYSESIINNKKKIKAEIYYTSDTVEIYFKDERIAVHKRDYTEKKYITNPDHMPEKHKKYLERWNPERIISLARSKGEYVSKLLEKILNKYKHPEQSYNTCRGIIFLSRTYGVDRLNTACKKALHFGYFSYKAIYDMLRNNNENFEEEVDLFVNILPEHNNIRGKSYFKKKLKELFYEQHRNLN